jgi:prevent-host-death family protein
MRWQLQEAKQRFSELVRAAAAGEPQVVTKHGQDVAVVIDIAEYRRLRGDPVSFLQFLRAEPLLDADVDLVRQGELPRQVDLSG